MNYLSNIPFFTGCFSIGLCLFIQTTVALAKTPQSAVEEAELPESSLVVSTEAINLPTNANADLNLKPLLEPNQVNISQIESVQTNNDLEQITSVSQFSDVQPTDWAFKALQSLVERYGCITGYSDNSFRGYRALTRYEFATGLNACLERVSELAAQATVDLVKKDDLLTLQRLQQEFSAELTTLRGRVDTLEAHTAEIEANQFSTTTKLSGQAVFAVTGGTFSGDRIIDVTGREITNSEPNTTFIYRVGLDLNTSFQGTDLLKIRLDQGSNGLNDNAAGFLEPNFGSVLDYSTKPPTDNFGLSRLYYTFQAFDNFTVTAGPRMTATDFLDKNSYSYLSFLDFSTQAFVNNYILFPVQGLGAGAAVNWKPNNGYFTVRAAYVSLTGDNPGVNSPVRGLFPLGSALYQGKTSSDRGLFGNPNQSIVELEYAPTKQFALRLQYSGGNIFDSRFDVFGVNFELLLAPEIALFGRYGFGNFEDTTFGDIKPNYWMAGVSFPDLFIKGARSGIAVGQPFIASELGNATQTNFEAFYNYPVSNNVRITPIVQVIVNPANQDANGTVVTGTLRTVFLF